MITILVPTDFSAVSKNAALYAIGLAKQVNASRIILYHTYQQPIAVDPTMPALQLFNLPELKETSDRGLEKFKNEVAPFAPGIILETKNEFALLTNDIADTCESTKADLIVMGITGGDKIDEVLIGSNAVSVAKHSPVPVIIVPANVSFRNIERIVLTSDFSKVSETLPEKKLRNVLGMLKAKLHVVNISDNELSDKQKEGSHIVESVLSEYNPEFHFVKHADFVEGINEYVHSNPTDLIITIPKKEKFFEGLFRRHHTKHLAFHTHVPLMVIHE
ncbi:MAG: universal stress protein [Chitinophagaceae bacterium]|nr:universal stress protein [Chitinophagaceae bacterium]